MEAYACYTQGTLVPCGDSSYEDIHSLKIGEIYKVKISDGRNYKFHKKYFALMRTAFEYLSEAQTIFFGNVESFRKTVEVAAGYFDMCYSIKYEQWIQVPRSISFDKMSEKDFSDLYERTKDVIVKSFIPDGDIEKFNEIITF